MKKIHPVQEVEGYAVFGPRMWVNRYCFVQRWAAKPSTWLRFLKKVDDTGYWVSGYSSRKEATR